MSSSRGAFYLLLIVLAFESSIASTRYFVKLSKDPSEFSKLKHPLNLRVLHYPLSGTRTSLQDESGTRIQDENESASKDVGPKIERRHSLDESSTFNPDVLNKFLEEYATKIRSTTEKNDKYLLKTSTSVEKPLNFGINNAQHMEKEIITSETVVNSTALQEVELSITSSL